MNCLKCGKAVPSSQAFCHDCLQSMDSYPVPAGTPVHIPQREKSPQIKPHRKTHRGYADTVRLMRKVIRGLCIALAVLTGALCVLLAGLLYTLDKYNEETSVGKNYSTIETNSHT